MSRAYQIKVSEEVRQVIRGEDHVKSHLEILAVLPCDEMIEVLAQELEKEGFQRQENQLKLTEGKVTVEVDLETGEVTVRSELSRAVTESGNEVAWGFDDEPSVAGTARDHLRKRLQAAVDRKETDLQKDATEALEAALGDIRGSLDAAVNRATAEALKQKAARLGQIKEINEDEEGGSLTIVVEV